MDKVISKDGTAIAYAKSGSGEPLILVDGALCSMASGPNGPLAALLRQWFTVYVYDRRGRGGSGDAAAYETQREIEDIDALIGEAGGSVCLYGISSGAALALEAAARLPGKVRKLALYEAPFIVDNSRPPVPADYERTMNKHLAEGRPGAAVKLFMGKGVRVPAVFLAMMPLMPAWKGLKAVAHTLPYDTALTIGHQRGQALKAERWASVTMPVLVGVGGKSPAWMKNGMRMLADMLPNGRLQTLEGQTHLIKPAALVPALKSFFAG